MKVFQKLYVLVACLLLSAVQAAFYDCNLHLGRLKSDQEALDLVKKAFQEKYKFSSQCLEMVLKKNFYSTGEFLINEYYPKTSIDTEIIVRNVANEIKRNQNNLIFLVKKRETDNNFPNAKPVVYWA